MDNALFTPGMKDEYRMNEVTMQNESLVMLPSRELYEKSTDIQWLNYEQCTMNRLSYNAIYYNGQIVNWLTLPIIDNY